jgi:TRAP-type mannitol/chloroaromatic compound transport system permease large subunit
MGGAVREVEVLTTISRPIKDDLLFAHSDANAHEVAHATVAPAATDSARVAVSDRRALAQTARQIAHVCRAFVLVVTVLGALAFGHAATSTLTAIASATTIARRLTAPNQRNHAQRADTQESE